MRALYIMEISNKEETQNHENIYKFCRINSEGAKSHAIIFRGNSDINQVDELFDDLEITNMKLHNTQVAFSGRIIHQDDTIQTIKHKLL